MRAAVAGLLAVVAAVASALGGGGASRKAGVASTGPTSSVTAPASSLLPTRLPRDPAQLAADLNQAQGAIDDPSSSVALLRSAGWLEQLAGVALVAGHGPLKRAVLARLTAPAAATLRAELGAGASLSRLNTPRRNLPPWRILAPAAPQILLGYFRAAQARFGVPWQYLAAIELIETDFGRVDGLSTAGAEGPMQFIPSTWAEYGSGNVHNPRDAIFAAARYLVANGAPGDMAGAVYHYNPNGDYVAAVRDYATRMTADGRAFSGYYYRQVIYSHVGGLLILPEGFPRARPVPLRLFEGG